MLPGKRNLYRCCKAKRSASQVNKEFWQQFQNYAPPSLRVIRTKFARTIIGERSEPHTLGGSMINLAVYVTGFAKTALIAGVRNWRASEANETLSGLFNRESRIYILSLLLLENGSHYKAS